jgi:hypothetical protein
VARFLSGSVGVIRSMSDPLLMLTSFYEKLCTFDIGLLTGFYRVLAVGLDYGSTDPLRKNRLVAAGSYPGLKPLLGGHSTVQERSGVVQWLRIPDRLLAGLQSTGIGPTAKDKRRSGHMEPARDVFACAPGREVTTLVAPDQALVRPTPCNPFRINIIISVLYARSCVSHTKHRGLCMEP